MLANYLLSKRPANNPVNWTLALNYLWLKSARLDWCGLGKTYTELWITKIKQRIVASIQGEKEEEEEEKEEDKENNEDQEEEMENELAS